MSQALQDLQRRIKSADDLYGVVRTMKTMAAVNIRQYEQSLRSLDDYCRTVELGLKAVLRDRPAAGSVERPRQTVLLVLGSDQGMVGRFNELVIDAAEEFHGRARQQGDLCRLWAIGEKAAAGVAQRLGEVAQSFRPPASAQAITGTVQQLLLRFESWRRHQGETRLVLFHNVPAVAAGYEQRQVALLPPDREWLDAMSGQRWPGRCLPQFSQTWQPLFAALISEYLFVSLFRAVAASLAAENAARLAAMQRAEKNIEEMLTAFRADYHTVRQNSITEELFDVIAGFEALRSERGDVKR